MYTHTHEFSSTAAVDRFEQDEDVPAGSGAASNGEVSALPPEGEEANASTGSDGASGIADAAQMEEAATAASNTAASSLHIQMLGLAGEAIAGLVVRVAVEGEIQDLQTDDEGSLPEIRGLAGVKLEISVQRFDGSFKLIDRAVMPGGNSQWGFVSPKTVFNLETTVHEGEAGDVEQDIPGPVPSDKGLETGWELDLVDAPASAGEVPKPVPDRQESAPFPVQEPTAQTSPPAKASAETLSHTPIRQAATPRPSVPARYPSPKTPAICSASQAQRHLIPPEVSGKNAPPVPAAPKKSGRDKDGNPLLVYWQKATDWWGKWQLPTWDVFRAREGKARRDSIDRAIKRPAGILAALPPCASTGTAVFDSSMLERVASLLQFAEEQTQYLYKRGTSEVLASMGKGTFNHESGEKLSSKAQGMCYQYVKIALSRCGIVEGYVGDKSSYEVQESASKSASALIEKGFVDVTEEVPDARWAAAGDVIVYAWSEKTWERRKEKKNNPNLPNHGHIDIRSYGSYISDFIPKSPRASPEWVVGDESEPARSRANYVNVRIYRKIFDPLPTCNLRAFLRCLREYECQQYRKDEDRYMALNVRLPTDGNGSLRFQGFDTHPWATVPADLRGIHTAAGAYQIVYSTWKEKFDLGFFPDLEEKPKFSPIVQDRIAVVIIESRNALPHVRRGEIDQAVELLRKTWTSLPGGNENKNRRTADRRAMDMEYLKELFSAYLNEEKRKWRLA